MEVLVTGATGFIGIEVARQLAWRSWQPRSAVRRPSRGPLVDLLDAEVVHADLLAPETLRRAVGRRSGATDRYRPSSACFLAANSSSVTMPASRSSASFLS
jgi:nucleoside-diphosphate-sugar epimerase